MRRPRVLQALRGERPDTTPIWLMRQAGRHLPGYRALRAAHPILEIARTPELAAEATLEPLRRYDVDAGVVFADITLPFAGLGVDFAIEPSVGPVVPRPVRSRAEVEALRPFSARESVPYVGAAIERFLELERERPILGFAGGPFTLASYLIEGRPDRELPATRRMLYSEPEVFDALVGRLVEMTIDYLKFQASSGAEVLQIFETWIGSLGLRTFERHLLGPLSTIVDGLAVTGRPVILFSTGSSHLLAGLAATGAPALGVDWREPLGSVRRRLGPGVALQGNLDPAALLGGPERLRREAVAVLDEVPDGRGHVFNLGHGVPPDAAPERVGELVELVHRTGFERGRR